MRIYHSEAELGKKINLSTEEKRHIKVLRLRPTEQITVFDGKGREYVGKYVGKVRDQLLLEEEVQARKGPARRITLAIAPSKGGRMDFLIEKATELGVSKIVPIMCEHSIVKPSAAKITRWGKISQEAACQSGRATIPEVTALQSFKEVVEKVSDYDTAYICDPAGEDEIRGESVLVLVGPEGGFSKKELETATNSGIKRLKLSNNILRTETAGVIAISRALE